MSTDQNLSDLDLLVAYEIASVDCFGYGSYRFENQERQKKFEARRDEIRREAVTRGLMTETGALTEKGKVLNPQADPRVEAKSKDNQSYFHARFGGGQRHVSPYGEDYGR